MHTVISMRNKNNVARPENILFSDTTKVDNIRKEGIRVTFTQKNNKHSQIVDLVMFPTEAALLADALIDELRKLYPKRK